eukprot:scaffold646482_cov22-Prasinocladus_malaysianus.AAC.1
MHMTHDTISRAAASRHFGRAHFDPPRLARCFPACALNSYSYSYSQLGCCALPLGCVCRRHA